ncbi:MAG: hypothetical protein INR62_04690 [Rhodospirillales bacterium]|nr:hypothetical protein [Acetobacter sp.]
MLASLDVVRSQGKKLKGSSQPLGLAPICSRGGGASDLTSGRADTRRGPTA